MRLLKPVYLFAAITTIALVISFLAAFACFFLPVETMTMEMQITVGNITGFNVGTEVVYFGKVPGRGHAERKLNVTNTAGYSLIAYLYADGNISEFVSFSRNGFVLEGNSTEMVSLMADIPEGTKLGDYSGTLYVEFRRAI